MSDMMSRSHLLNQTPKNRPVTSDLCALGAAVGTKQQSRGRLPLVVKYSESQTLGVRCLLFVLSRRRHAAHGTPGATPTVTGTSRSHDCGPGSASDSDSACVSPTNTCTQVPSKLKVQMQLLSLVTDLLSTSEQLAGPSNHG
jgi:hypothetical protein